MSNDPILSRRECADLDHGLDPTNDGRTEMSNEDAIVEIAHVLVKLWYSEVPFENQKQVYNLVKQISREMLEFKEDSFERSEMEMNATIRLSAHYKV